MKLFYDMLIPYMPDTEADATGKFVPSKQKVAGRQAMEELSKFQMSNNIIHLYQAVLYGCLYANVDLVDTILNLSDDIEIPSISINDALDLCARMLFQSIKTPESFEIDKFAAYILTSAHAAFVSINAQAEAAKQNASISEEEPVAEAEDTQQISIEDVMPTD